MGTLSEFISTHRGRFTNDHNNAFAFSWAKVTRRLAFLDLIQSRYAQAGAAFVANSDAMRKVILPGDYPLTTELEALHAEGARLSIEVHLEIESFYLFAKIILDDVSRALEFYFGAANGLALDSHDDLAKRLARYAVARSLEVSPEFISTVVNLRERICDFRDQKISHEKSPRTTRGSAWGADGRPRIMMIRINPRDTDPQQAESEPLDELRAAIDSYIEEAVALILLNESRTKFEA